MIHFTYPISDTKHWHGELEVSATVDGHDAEIHNINYTDQTGKRSNVTFLIEQWCDALYERLIDAAITCSVDESDYTLENQ